MSRSNHSLKGIYTKEIEIKYILEILGIKRSGFFELLKEYRNDPDNFSISYHRKTATRKIDKEIEENILKVLSLESRLIDNKDMPIRWYNYSYVNRMSKNIFKKIWQSRSSLTWLSEAWALRAGGPKDQVFYDENKQGQSRAFPA